jgi:hypothetical protein
MRIERTEAYLLPASAAPYVGGTVSAQRMVWVTVVSGEFLGERGGPTRAWLVEVIDSSSGERLARTSPEPGAWPDQFASLTDRSGQQRQGTSGTVRPIRLTGILNLFEPPTSTKRGRLTVGSLTYEIAPGASFTARMGGAEIGSSITVVGSLEGSGRLVEFGFQPFPASGICGTVVRYKSSDSQSAGFVTFGTEDVELASFIIPKENELAASLGYHCFMLGLADTGDGAVLREIPPQPVTLN